MSWADASRGVQGAVQQQLLRRMQEQQFMAQEAERQRRAQIETRTADRADQELALRGKQYEAGQVRQAAQDALTAEDRAFTRAGTLAEQIPADTFLAEGDPSVGMLQRGGRGALLEPTPALPGMGEDFQGPMNTPGGETPQAAQLGREQGRIKTQTAAQANTLADNARADQIAAAAQARQVTTDAAAAATASQNTPEAKFSAFKQRHDYEVAHPKPGALSGSPVDHSDVDAIADSIIRGEQPPETTGLYRMGGPVRAALAKQGYNLATAQQDFRATTKHFATLNGSQQTRMRQAVDNAYHSLDVIEDLSGQWKGGKFPLLNKGQLAAAKAGTMGPEYQQIATNLEAQISDVASELGNVYMGGNSPTDHALSMASKNLSADWTEAQLKSAINLARRNLQIRQNSIQNTGVVGASAGNPYGGGGQPAATSPATTPAAPAMTPADYIKKYGG